MSSRPRSAVREVLEVINPLKSRKDKGPDPVAVGLQAFNDRKGRLVLQIGALPEGARKYELNMLLDQAAKSLGSDLRKPDLDAGTAALDNVDEAIKAESRRLQKQGPSLEDQKRKIASESDNVMGGERAARAMPAYAKSRKELRLRLPATLAQADQLLADFDRDLAKARLDLKTQTERDAKDDAVTAKKFTEDALVMIQAVRTRAADFARQLEALRDGASVKPEDQWAFFEANKAEPDVARTVVRSDQIAAEIPGLQAAVDKLGKRMKELQAERAKEPNLAAKKALEAEYNAASAQKKQIATRLAQLDAYRAGEDARLNTLILGREKLAGVDAAGDAMLAKAGDRQDAAFNGLRAVAEEPDFTPFDKAVLDEKDAELRAQFLRSSQRVMRTDRIYPNEPDVTEISAKECAALVKLLDVAMALVKSGDFPLASAAQKDAQRLWMEFVQGNKHALPIVPDAPPEPAELLGSRLKRLEPRVLDLSARGHPRAKTMVNARLELAANVLAETQQETVGWKQLTLEVVDFEQRLAKAEAELPVASSTRGSRAAKASGQKVNAALLEMYRTEKIADPSKIEDPTRDWGPGGPPKDLIPLEQVLTVGEGEDAQHYRIRTYETGGKDVDRRQNKDVPREMMAHLRSRGETLALMSSTLAQGMEDDIVQYAAETEALLGAVSSAEGQAAYEEIAAILKSIAGWLVERPLDKYIPDGLVEAKRDLGVFKKEYLTQMPHAALAGAKKLKEEFTALREKGSALRQQYRELGERITGVHLELSSILTDSGMGSGEEIGARMGRLFNGEAAALAKKAKGLDPAVKKRIEDAQEKMMAQVDARTAGANNFEGQWRQQLEDAWRMKEGLSQTAITTASTTVDKIVREIRAFHDKLDGIDKLKDQALLDFLGEIATRMEDGANGAQTSTALEVDWDAKRKAAGDQLKAIEKVKLGDRTNAEELKGRVSAMKARLEATEKQVKKFLDRNWGIEQMASLAKELDQLYADVTGDPPKKKREVSKILAAPRAQAVQTMLQRLVTEAAAAADIIDTRVAGDAMQGTTYARQIDAAKQALRNVRGLPDASTLVALCTQIDANRPGSKGPEPDHEATLQRREKALAELNRIRRALETHPAVTVYRGNPFDSGRVYPLVMGAFHQAEIGILVSVDPHAA
jgi:hypothetical protein